MNPKCQTRPGFDTFSARSADLTGLKMRRITRGVSFDYLVSVLQERLGNSESEGFRRLEIDHQLELARQLYRKFARLGAFQDAIDVAGRLPIMLRQINAI